MSKKIEIVKEFYEALNKRDYKIVNGLYHSEAKYRDEIFDFNGIEIHALWYNATLPEMDISVKLESIREEGDKVITEWEMRYTLDIIKRRINLKEKGVFEFKDEKIYRHTDTYDFWAWCTQAFGAIGRVMGWSNWLRNRVRNQARKSVLTHLYSAQGKLKK